MREIAARDRPDEEPEIFRKGYDKPLIQKKPTPAREPTQPASEPQRQGDRSNGSNG